MTNDVAEARPGGDAAYGASLTPKGKIILDVFAHRASSDVNDGAMIHRRVFYSTSIETARRRYVSSHARVFASSPRRNIFESLTKRTDERTHAVYAKFTQDESAEKGDHHE